MKLHNPLIIIGAPRSGTTFLHELLSLHPELWHLPAESHHILEGPLHPRHFNSFSNRPHSGFALQNDQVEKLRKRFWQGAINVDAVPGGKELLNKVRDNRYMRKAALYTLGSASKLYKPENSIRFLEKTPKNIVRIPAIRQLFPDARFIYLKRNAVDNIYSIFKGWTSETGMLYKVLTGRPRFARSGYKIEIPEGLEVRSRYWKFVLPPGWQTQEFNDLLDVCIFQYLESNKWAQEDLQATGNPAEVASIQYEELSSETETVVRRLLSFADLSTDDYDFDSLRNLPNINVTNSKGEADTLKSEIADRLAAVKTDYNLKI